MEEKKLATMICIVCGKEIEKNYARNTIGNYCKTCAFDRALNIQIDKDYASGEMDENIIFDVEKALENNQDAGCYVGDLLNIIHRLQGENAELKEDNESWEAVFKIGEERKYRKMFNEEWKKEYQKELDKEGEGLIAGSPDFDYVYQRYFEQKAEIERLSIKVWNYEQPARTPLYNNESMVNCNLVTCYNENADLKAKNAELQKQVDKLTDKLGKVLSTVGIDEYKQSKAIEQAVKYTAKKCNDFIHALICKYNGYIDRKDGAYGNMHKEADEFAKEKFGVEVE